MALTPLLVRLGPASARFGAAAAVTAKAAGSSARSLPQSAMPVSLTSHERAHLKARAHGLEPMVQIGHAGVTDALVAEVDRALTAHELIKVRLGDADRDARDAHATTLSARTDAVAVQRVGKVLVLWRPRPDVPS